MTALDEERGFRAAGIGAVLAVLLCWAVLSVFAVMRQGSWADEAGYIIKSWWYVSGAVRPYSPEDATWYQPLIFYALGGWQWIFGHDIVASRAFSMVVTAVNIALLASLLRRLNCSVWPIAFAIIIFALTEDSIFYFDSATPFAAAICLQLAALHLLVGMDRRASLAVAIGFGAVLTAIYLIRINLIVFIALCLAIAWVRAGRDRWLVYFCSAAIFLVSWSALALVWGRQFVYVTLWLPIVTDLLIQAGILPKLYPTVAAFSHQNVLQPSASLKDMLAYAFSYGMLLSWIIGHHVVPIAAASIATIAAALRPIKNRGWIALFAVSYWGLMLFHHLGAQSYCPICIQAYANFFDYLAALAGGLCLDGLMQNSPTVRLARAGAVGAVVTAIGLSAAQAWSLSGGNKLPSIRNQTDSFPHEVRIAGEAMRKLLPAGSKVEFVGSDVRISLALASVDVRVPPVTLSLVSFYRKLDEHMTAEQRAQTIEEIRQVSFWTDVIAQEWIQDSGDWMVVQRQPVGYVYPWLTWTPNGPLIKTGLEKCFEPVAEQAFNDFVPPLAIALYRRVRRGKVCLGE